MSTLVAKPIAVPIAQAEARAIRICHFTLAHNQLKSRSFHRELLPLASAGFDVRYVSPAANSNCRKGVSFIPVGKHANGLRRFFAFPSLFAELMRQRADVYHFQDPELIPVALALKVISRKRIVYDAYEDFPSAVENKKWIPKPLAGIARWLLGALENCGAWMFEGVMTADPLTLRRFARRGKSQKIVFYNFPNLDFFPVPGDPKPEFDLIYRGGVSERTGIFGLLEALRLLTARGKTVRLLLIGYFDSLGDERKFRAHIRSIDLESNIDIRGRLDHERMAGTLSEARIGICPLLAAPKFLRNIPVKVFEYWACAMPTIATDLPPIRPFLRHGDAGLLVPPGDHVALASLIEWLIDHPDDAERMGRRGRDIVEQRLNNSAEVHKLRRFLVEVASQ